MKKYFLPLFFLFFLIIEGVFVYMLPASVLQSRIVLVPHFLLLSLLFMVIYYHAKTAIIYALIFGFLYELIYVEVIGGYLVAFPIIIYLSGITFKFIHPNALTIALIAIIDVTFIEYFGYGFTMITQGVNLSNMEFIQDRLLPTLVLNLVFISLFGYLLKKFFISLHVEKDDLKMWNN